ncbi:hypothetical protein NDU88_000629 [Pleurodeles waltl]|uniref:Uncharacterized protein n=1 Tax=Pleurodeles waltl TaxID=8319 RepID=A0AAV7S7H9_PLEWA|nr:hypothetical protein NDU88_000629 [Pleurodeles waltl]
MMMIIIRQRRKAKKEQDDEKEEFEKEQKDQEVDEGQKEEECQNKEEANILDTDCKRKRGCLREQSTDMSAGQKLLTTPRRVTTGITDLVKSRLMDFITCE